MKKYLVITKDKKYHYFKNYLIAKIYSILKKAYFSKYTCNKCKIQKSCPYSFIDYNTDGQCLFK